MGIQTLIVVLIALLWSWSRFDAMTSTLLGGAVFIVPNVFFAHRFFRSGQAADPKKIVRTFYVGELLKLVITIGLALLIFIEIPVLVLPFLTGLVSAALGLWFAPFIFIARTKVAST